jgi:hypothetical protein
VRGGSDLFFIQFITKQVIEPLRAIITIELNNVIQHPGERYERDQDFHKNHTSRVASGFLERDR